MENRVVDARGRFMSTGWMTPNREFRRVLPELLPHQGCWTEEEYLVLTDHATRLVEFTDGFVEVLPIPSNKHQTILKRLFRRFDARLDPAGGIVQFAPLRLRIRSNKYREPDLLALLRADDPRLQDRYWTGADLALEVVSKLKPQRDLVDKRFDYAEGRVPEYWIVNPMEETITVLVLGRKVYREYGIFQVGEKATSVIVTEFAIDVAEIFA
jgi:Uma2 family endonuclease